ncbi:MAG: 3-phosphoshikimate 1-carboxyvinyltransferase, partial [Pseudomonadota bacterium]|nr:3-phosphoshikimate 1-carboxyvinyltransferase [Pseudomonadota bacterium]
QVEEGEDYLSVMAPAHWQHALLDTYDDHRMAMCSALIAFSPVGVSINDPQCCSKTYPQFFDEFSRLCHD